MVNKCSREVSHVLILVLMFHLLPCFSQSAPFSASATGKPSSFKVKVRGINNKEKETNALPKLEGRKMLSNGIIAGSSPSGRAPERNDIYHRRSLSIYSPNAIIRAGPSTSGQGPKKNDNYHGRRLLSIYSPNSIIGARPSTSGQATKIIDKYHGRRLMSIYFPNAEIGAGGSKSGHGGGRTPVASP